ncbi:Rieske 2Fe-2S domain-containing protein [Agrobacterium tumefaciens]|uniref:Rieske 2Fe-2S domain-containing protein n=1 Tax=Agrobacterium tumefaciens TaxID=358 RepID=A0A4D7YKI7_AGRTU|nr:Rieske 2Fe-2S domain-containing protein [Agrobacterium tumefaciens]QCL97871.1 Rieske 2Fe-2S domain-containing protein [Agrobacterium tumefaciens]
MSSSTIGLWTPVALSSDLPPLAVMPARLGTETIALWRSASGRISASADRCPHRGMRLSHGFVRGESLSCIYHGWSYGQEGNCLKIPAHPGLVPPDSIRVATFTVAEQEGFVWAAISKPPADPPRLHGLMPLRSISVAASLEAIQIATGARIDTDGILSTGDGSLSLLLSDQGNGETLMHVLVADGADAALRIGASRAAEALRRQAEARASEGVTT